MVFIALPGPQGFRTLVPRCARAPIDHPEPMAASRKQVVYTRILDWALPHARNVQTWAWWRRVSVDLYPELELVHNVGPLLREPRFTDQDIYWINAQARNYSAQRAVAAPVAHPVLEAIAELIALVPPELQSKLEWHGPEGMSTPGADRRRHRHAP